MPSPPKHSPTLMPPVAVALTPAAAPPTLKRHAALQRALTSWCSPNLHTATHLANTPASDQQRTSLPANCSTHSRSGPLTQGLPSLAKHTRPLPQCVLHRISNAQKNTQTADTPSKGRPHHPRATATSRGRCHRIRGKATHEGNVASQHAITPSSAPLSPCCTMPAAAR